MKIIDLFISKLSKPIDRIFSAYSEDGLTWIREQGIRVEKTKNNPVENAFYCFIHQPEDLNGFYEMFYHGSSEVKGRWKTQILRAVSEDGLNWDRKPEVILENQSYHPDSLQQIRAPHLVKAGSLWRMYFTAKGLDGVPMIYSAVSQDRLQWEIEEDVRVSPENFKNHSTLDNPAQAISDTSIMTLPDGSLRMFFSVYRDGIWKQNICSALSKNGLDWKVEDGVRIDFGPAGYRFIANNPAVIEFAGKWRMYFRGSNNMPIKDKIFVAESSDGLLWVVQGVVLSPNPACYKEKQEVAHPFVFKTRDNLYRMFYTGCCGLILDSFSYRYYENIYREKGVDILYD